MTATTHEYELRVINATPWTPSVPGLPAALAKLDWRHLAGDACMIAGLLAFATCMVLLQLSLYPHAFVSSRVAVLVTLGLGAAGVGAFFAEHYLHDTPAPAKPR